MLKFSQANAKIKALASVPGLMPYLTNKRKVYSFDMLSGHNCPYSKDCKSMAVETNGKRKIVDGKHTKFRCFSASQEVLYTALYNLRKGNQEILELAAKPMGDIVAGQALLKALPKNAGIIRIHVGGDMKTQAYFDAWCYVARNRPDMLFYAYTKSTPFWVKRLGIIPDNLVLTASRGGMRDDLITKYKLREAVVIFDKESANGLPIDHDDSHAADPTQRGNSFALLIHGVQPKDSPAAAALKALKGEGSYS